MENKKAIFSSKVKGECVSDTERGETIREYEMQEISDEKVELLVDVSTGATPKSTTAETFVKVNDKSCASSSPETSGFNESIEAVSEAAKSARKGASACHCVIAIAENAICEGKKRLNTAYHYAERVPPNHVNHYLTVISKYRLVLDRLSESINKAGTAGKKAYNAADNADKAGENLSKTTRKSNSKDAELWAASAIATARQTKTDAFKAAYGVLKVTKKFWQEVDNAINLETSFRTSIHRSNGTLKTSDVVLFIALLLGCIIVIINHHMEIEHHLYYLVFFIGCALIMGSLFTGIVRLVGCCIDKENGEEMMKIRKELEVAENSLHEYDDYFAKNKITPVPSDSSENEVADSRVTDETPLIRS